VRVFFWINICLVLILFSSNTLEARWIKKNPDFTKGEKLEVTHRKMKVFDRMLGPTGLWCIMYSLSMNQGATRDTRQMLINKVEKGSPADGKIKIGDVIIGVEGKKFARDARKALADAIQKAEANSGELSLYVWRDGKTNSIKLQLEVFGRFDPDKPFDNPYNDALIEKLSKHVIKGVKAPFPSLGALGMLSTGRDDLMPLIKAYAKTAITSRTKGPLTFEVSSNGKRVWQNAYKLIFLSEYYMMTKDKSVLPALKLLAEGTSMAQSGVGSYGHRFSGRKPDGSYHGPLAGYGAINNAGISMLTGILLAERAGIKHPEITNAIRRGKRFFDFYVEHGCVSYGDHWAGYDSFDNNGTSGISAIMYGLLGDDRGQQYWGAMSVASAPTGREEGHQGCYWAILWNDLGAAWVGDEALKASFMETRYQRTLERSWKGEVIDQSNIGPTKYKSRGDVTATRLLLYSIGSKRLHIQGKGMIVTKPLTGKALVDTLEGGRLIYNSDLRNSLREDRIFELLAHPLTPVRISMGKTLYHHKRNVVDKLINMLSDNRRYARYGAVNALSQAGYNSPEAVKALTKRIEQDEDIIFRYFAIEALVSGKNKDNGLHSAAISTVPLLLKLASSLVPNDPRQHLHFSISEALFYYKKGLYDEYIKNHKANEKHLVKAIRNILQNENGRARSHIPFDRLTEKQLDSLWKPILSATKENAPSGIMFSKGVRLAGVKVLGKHRIKEGLELYKELSSQFLSIPYKVESARYVPWFGEPMLEALPNFGTHGEAILSIVEKWSVLEGRGKEFAKKIPEVRKKMNEKGTPSLKSSAN